MAKGKDPAALFYIDKWLTATAEMRADCRGWYLNLILHQFDKGDLPNDLEELAALAQVRISEYEMFKQVFKQVLEQKFKLNERGRLENDVAAEIIQRRETFKDERARAGKIGYFVKYIKRNFNKLSQDLYFMEYVKNSVEIEKIDTKDEQVLKQVLKHLLKLYRNENKDIYNSIGIGRLDAREIESLILEEGAASVPKPEPDPADDANLLPAPPPVVNGDMLSPKMLARFKHHFPKYYINLKKDYGNCLQIAYRIAETEGWTPESVTNGKMEDCLEIWETAIHAIKSDKYLSGLDLHQLNNQWGSVTQRMNPQKPQNNETHFRSNPTKPKSTSKQAGAEEMLGSLRDDLSAIASIQ